MKSCLFGTSKEGWRPVQGWIWLTLLLLFGRIAAAEEPRIQSIESRGPLWILRVLIPPGTVRIVIEGCHRDDLKAWIPKATARVSSGQTTIELAVESDATMELFRVRADTDDPLPAAWYTGSAAFPAEPASDPTLVRRDVEDAGPVAGGEGEGGRTVVESDIWVMRGDNLFFFNQLRGLQVIGLADPDAPVLRSTFRLPGVGEQMYLADDHHAVLLGQDPCRQWGTDAESAVWVVDTSMVPPQERARLPLKGRLVESRWVGQALYVATETWEPVNDGTGTWRSGTRVASFDFSSPEAPVVRRPLWFPGAGNVVAATDRFFFVAVTDYSRPWPWASDLEVLDITSDDGTVQTHVRIPLAGRVPDKFKIDVWEDSLRVVTEAVESPDSARFVTVLETYRLTDPRAMVPLPIVRLDRLELARGERLFATRFDGNRAYLVTFLRVDPLWVVDLSNPSDLRVAGEVEIPGWSTYLRPMGDRLLTLGVDDARGWRVAVQLFDVSDPAKPTLLSKVPLGEDSSWSEANHDEKAFGVFPEIGLLLVPVSEWKADGGVHGVQLLDLGRDTLTQRGFLASDSVVPRRSTYHRGRVITASGRSLVAADISDRDAPKSTSSLELAYPVERVLVVGGHLLEFQAGSLRVRGVEDPEGGTTVPIDDLPVLGATEVAGRLHLLQGRAAEVQWDHDAVEGTWYARTNAGVLTASTWDVSALPGLARLGQTKAPTDATGLSDAEALWPTANLLVWASKPLGSYPWRLGLGAWDLAPAPAMGIWRPWWGWSTRRLVAVEASDPANPRILSDLAAGAEGEAAGGAFAQGGLVYMSRQRTESEVLGTNLVVETAWFPLPAQVETNLVVGADGTTRTNVVVRNEGSWRPVTNAYPILRWWSRHALDVADYAADPIDPIRRPEVALPGALEGVARGGALLLTAAWKTDPVDGTRSAWLDASSYDGVLVRRVDGLRMADEKRSETYALATRDGVAYVARGGWAVGARQRLERWDLGADGRWVKGAEAPMEAVPGEMRLLGDLLLTRGGGILELFAIEPTGGLIAVPTIQAPGCFGGDLGRGDGSAGQGLWLPMGEYGAFRVGP